MADPAPIPAYGAGATARDPRPGRIGRLLRGVLWWLAGAAVLGGAGFLLAWTGLFLFAPVFLLLGLGTLLLAAGNAVRLRRRRADVVLGHVAAAVRLGLPLTPYLRAAAEGEPRAARRTTLETAELIEAGGRVGDALGAAAPGREAAARELAAAEDNGVLPEAARRLDDAPADDGDGDGDGDEAALVTPSVALTATYAAVVLLTLLAALGFLAVFVVPKFEEIFADFGVPLPASTRSLLGAARSAVDTPWLLLGYAVVVGLGLPYAVGRALRALVVAEPRRPWGRPLLGRAACRLPVVGRGLRARHWAAVLRATASGLRAGRPLDRAVAVAAGAGQGGGGGPLGARTARLAEDLAEGRPAAAALRRAGLARHEAGLLAAPPQGRLPERMEFLAAHLDNRHRQAAAWLAALATPAVTLAGGLLVGWVALALFEPMRVLAETVLSAEGMP